MGLVDGDAAVMLAEVFRERWKRATGEEVPVSPETSSPRVARLRQAGLRGHRRRRAQNLRRLAKSAGGAPGRDAAYPLDPRGDASDLYGEPVFHLAPDRRGPGHAACASRKDPRWC